MSNAALWRPPQQNTAQLWLMSATLAKGDTPQNFYFDAVLRSEHTQEARATQHPVQVGAAISDHVYLLPARVVLEIGMSDSMDSYVTDQYSSWTSKSVAAYQTFLQIQSLRVPIQLTTKLNTYNNMVIVSVHAVDTKETRFALRAAIVFQEIIPAQISVTTISVTTLQGKIMSLPRSARPQVTDLTNEGVKSVQDPSAAVATNFELPTSGLSALGSGLNTFTPTVNNLNVPGAGTWSSNPIPATHF